MTYCCIDVRNNLMLLSGSQAATDSVAVELVTSRNSGRLTVPHVNPQPICVSVV